jgi:hypothetical protein
MRDVILFVDSSQYGGIEAHIIELVKLLKSDQFNVSVLFYQQHHNQQLYHALNMINCSYYLLDGKPLSLYFFLKTKRNSVVHTHGYKAGIIGRITCKLMKITCVSTYHAGEKGVGKVRLYNWLDRLTSGLSHNLVVSPHLLNSVKKSQFLANFIVPQHHHKDKTPDTLIHIAFVGRLSYEKGPDRFIALAEYFNNQSSFHFDIYGSGPMENQLRGSAPSNVTFHGHQVNTQFWQSIDVLVLCSREEGLPMVILEAMDRKVLCICYPVGAVKSVIINDQSGMVTDQQSQAQLIAKCEQLLSLSHQQKNSLINNASARLASHFSGKQQLTMLANLYLNQ